MKKTIDYWDIIPNIGVGEFKILDKYDKIIDYLNRHNISYCIEPNIVWYSVKTNNMNIAFDKRKHIFAISVFNDFKGKINNLIGLNSTLVNVKDNLGEYCYGFNKIYPIYELKGVRGVDFELSDDEKYNDMDSEWDETIIPIVKITVWNHSMWKKQTKD